MIKVFEKAITIFSFIERETFEISEFKHKNLNVNKLACTKDVQRTKFRNCSQKQYVNKHGNPAGSEVNKSKVKCYMC